MCWGDMQKRLEELGWRTQEDLPEKANHGELTEIPAPKVPKAS